MILFLECFFLSDILFVYLFSLLVTFSFMFINVPTITFVHRPIYFNSKYSVIQSEWNVRRKSRLHCTYLSTLFTNVKRFLLYVTYTVHDTPAQNSLFPLPENIYDTTGVFAMDTIPLHQLNLLFKIE